MRSQLPDDLLASTDKNFRPVDPQIGPDGALWFGDWCNALIGHMQYSQRDPNRDHQRGRIYRLVYTKKTLLEPVTQFDKSEAELLEQLREYEPRTRYRARRELRDRPTDVVVAAVKEWVAGLDPNDPEYDRLRCEALWVLQGHHAVDPSSARRSAEGEDAQCPRRGDASGGGRGRLFAERVRVACGRRARRAPARAAGSDSRAELFPDAERLCRRRWRCSTRRWIRGSSTRWSIRSSRSSRCGTMRFKPARSQPTTAHAKTFIDAYIARRAPSTAAQAHLKALVNPEAAPRSGAKRTRESKALRRLRKWQPIFGRVCASCHKLGEVGFTFGPELSDVGKRLSRHDIIESIIEPSKKVDPKYVTTTIVTNDGKIVIGFILEKNKDSVTLLIADGKQETIRMDEIDEMAETKQSSMPENLASTLAPAEFLDVVEYLTTRK